MIELIGLGIGAALLICAADVPAPRARIAAPLLLVLAGIALSFIPSLRGFELEPELVLEVILPPLLYASAVAMPAMSFRRELPPIGGLAVALVLISSLSLGLLFAWLVPDLGFV